MNNTFSQEVSTILIYSREEARRTASSYVQPEHILLGMLRHKKCALHEVLRRLSVDEQQVRQGIDSRIHVGDADTMQPVSDMQLDDAATNILMLAVLEARKQHAAVIDTQHLLLAILHDKADNGAKLVLNHLNMDYDNTLAMLQTPANTPTNGIGLPDEDEEEETPGETRTTTTDNNSEKSKTPVLDNFSYDLTRAAREGKLDPVVGREKQIQRVIEILCRRKKNNPVIIGEPGVGKSAIVEGLAQLIARKETSPLLYDKRLVNLDLTSVVAGTKYRGQFEERIKALIKELEQQPDIIVFIDEIHTMIGAGSTPGSMDAANILKPALARGVIQCIGATTLDEYRNSIEKDGALERRFQKVIVEPTDKEETLHILHNIKGHYADFHRVNYTDAALEACVSLTARYVTDRAFPDKAIDALDEAGAKVHLQHAHLPEGIKELQQQMEEARQHKIEAVQKQDFEQAAAYRDLQQQLQKQIQQLTDEARQDTGEQRPDVTAADVADVLSIMTGVPVKSMEESEQQRLRNMPAALKQAVIAQDAAIDKLVKAIQRNRIGLRQPNHPIGVFMFLGPTGVGKTYLAKQLAQHLFGSSDDIIRIDMSEYTESFNVSRLIGAPPGYVGYEEGGQLTEQVRRKPYAIVLLDEIEKAHHNVFNLLLQVLDEGRLTDGNGRKVDFRNTIIILTSNAGTRQLKEFGRGVGFNAGNGLNILNDADKAHARQVIQKSLSRQFAPEFLNRLDDIITFDQLDEQAIRSIAHIEIAQLTQRMNSIGYSISVTDEAVDFVASKGYDLQFGARPLKRAVQQYIEDNICDFILNNEDNLVTSLVIEKAKDKEDLVVKAQSPQPQQDSANAAEPTAEKKAD